jgi:hypothetical protein
LRQVIELRHEFRRPLVAAFVDFKKAFDSIDRNRMYDILCAQGFPDKIVSLIRLLYKGATSCVRVRCDLSEYFDVKTGVKQGALLSPVLFILVLDYVLDRVQTTAGVDGLRINDTLNLIDLDYADDIALLASSFSEMQHLIDSLDNLASRVGLIISSEKTKVMANETAQLVEPHARVQLHGCDLEQVDHFTYLGSVISMDGDGSPEIRTRIAKAQGAFKLLDQSLWRNRHVSLGTKLAVYYAAVRPVLLYGCETWPMKTDDINKLQSFEYRCWRRMLHISYLDRVSNDEVRNRIQPKSLCRTEIQRRRLMYCGHLLRRDHHYIPRQCLMENPKPGWRRPRGGTRLNWQRTVQKDLKPLNLPNVYRDWSTDWRCILSEIAKDRPQWRQMTSNVTEG